MPGAKYGRALRDGEQPLAELGKEHMSRRTVRSIALSGRLSVGDLEDDSTE